MEILALRDALAGMPPALLQGRLRELAEAAYDPAERRAALAVLEPLAGARDLGLLLVLAAPPGPDDALPRELRTELQRALGAALGRAPEGVELLASAWQRAHPALLAPIARSIGRTDDVRALAALAGLLGSEPALDSLLLAELARLGAALPHPLPSGALGRVRAHLEGCPPEQLRLAAFAAGQLEDHAAIPRLLELLERGDEGVRRIAHGALRAVTGLRFPPDPERWGSWHAAEVDWWQRESAACLAGLRDPDPARVARSIRELAWHRLHRHELAAALLDSLRAPRGELVRLAAAALGNLESELALPALTALLDGADPDLAATARAAILRIGRARAARAPGHGDENGG